MATIRTIGGVPTTSVESGVYRLVLRENAFGTDKPAADTPSDGAQVFGFYSWSTPTEPTSRRSFSSILTSSLDPGNLFNINDDFVVQVRSELGASVVWTTSSGWSLSSSGTGMTRTITATPNNSVVAGTYRIALNQDAFGTDQPNIPIGSDGVVIPAPATAPTTPVTPVGPTTPTGPRAPSVNIVGSPGFRGLGNVFSLDPGTNDITDHGVSRRIYYAEFDPDRPNEGFFTQTASPMVSDGEHLYLISGFGGFENITSHLWASSRMPPGGKTYSTTDIRNWHLIKFGESIEQRVELFETNDKKGWDALQELAVLTNSFIGFDRFGRFFMKPKGGIRARVQSSAPSTIEFKDETDFFPEKGLISVNGELIAYDGIIGRQFLNLDRGYGGTPQQTGICAESIIYYVDSLLTVEKSIFNPITNANIRNTQRQLYNHVIINYDDPKPFEYEDGISIETYGKRTKDFKLPISRYQNAWVEQIARRFIEYHKDLHYLITVKAKTHVDVNITDTVYLQVPDRAKLNQPCQVYEVVRNPKNQAVDIVLRTL